MKHILKSVNDVLDGVKKKTNNCPDMWRDLHWFVCHIAYFREQVSGVYKPENISSLFLRFLDWAIY